MAEQTKKNDRTEEKDVRRILELWREAGILAFTPEGILEPELEELIQGEG